MKEECWTRQKEAVEKCCCLRVWEVVKDFVRRTCLFPGVEIDLEWMWLFRGRGRQRNWEEKNRSWRGKKSNTNPKGREFHKQKRSRRSSSEDEGNHGRNRFGGGTGAIHAGEFGEEPSHHRLHDRHSGFLRQPLVHPRDRHPSYPGTLFAPSSFLLLLRSMIARNQY